MKKIIKGILLLGLGVILVACGGETSDSEDTKIIRLATTYGPYSDLFYDLVAPTLQEQGYTIEEQNFSDMIAVNTAMQDGDVDLNVEQHALYTENFNNESGADLASLTPIPTLPAGLFPGVKESLDEVAAGDQIGVPQDPSNLTRALLLLEKVGWITLDDSVDPMNITEDHIIENVHGIEITPMDTATIPRSLPDLAYAVIPGSTVFDVEIDYETALALEDVLPELMLQVTVSGDNMTSEWAQAVTDIYQSQEFKNAVAQINEENQDIHWVIPE